MNEPPLLEDALDALLTAEHAAAAFWAEGVSQETVDALGSLAVQRRKAVLRRVQRPFPAAENPPRLIGNGAKTRRQGILAP